MPHEKAGAASSDQRLAAIESLIEMTKIGEEMMQLRQEIFAALFTEECCILYREYMDLLKAVYDGYKRISCYAGRTGKQMSYGAWIELVSDMCIVNEDFSAQSVGLAFALGKELRADITSDWPCMELSWSEFLVALAAIVVLQKDYSREFMADLLEDLFVDSLQLAREHVQDKKPGKARSGANYDASMAPLISFLGRMFEDADDDASGTVDEQEFRIVFSQPGYKEEMGRLGIGKEDFDMMFRALDRDGSGSLSLDELVDGFVKMKTAMKGMDRAISYIRKMFTDADEDDSGTLDFTEFLCLFERPATLKKLESVGITAEDIEDLFNVVKSQNPGREPEITVDHIIEGFVRLRDPKNAGLRGLRILGDRFKIADADGSGELSKEEVLEAFNSEEVVEKLKAAKLKAPDWATLFEELDGDGSGGLSLEELTDGMATFWTRDMLSAI